MNRPPVHAACRGAFDGQSVLLSANQVEKVSQCVSTTTWYGVCSSKVSPMTGELKICRNNMLRMNSIKN